MNEQPNPTDPKPEPIQGKIESRPGIRSIYAQRAYDFLKAGKPGDKLTREQATQIIGLECFVGSRGERFVNTTAITVLKQHRIAWKWDRGEKAWVCKDDKGKTTIAQAHITKSRKQAKRSLDYSIAVDVTALDAEARRDHDLNCVVAGMIQTMGSGAMRKKLEAKANGAGRLVEPDAGKLVELMRRKETS